MELKNDNMPKALKDCTIENSVVIFRYRSPFHRIHIQECVAEAFKADGVELQEFRAINENENSPSNEVRRLSYFSNGTLKFLVDRQAISFNCVSNYPGWETYFKFIKFAVSAIPNENLLFTEVGIRYISTYDLAIFDKLDGKVELNWYKDIEGAEIRFPAKGAGFKGLVRVTNLLRSVDGTKSKSFVDVDLTTSVPNGTLDNAFTQCEFIHHEEKKHYFQLLSSEFVNQLGPSY